MSKSETNPNAEAENKELTPGRGRSSSGNLMNQPEPAKPYDLEERTFLFASQVRAFMKPLPRTLANIEDGKQLIRASGSVGSNYIEANEALGKKDFLMHIRISRKESKESRYWLRLMDTGDSIALNDLRIALVQESTELMNIFGAILRKST